MNYNVDYFIKKFEAIPEENWCSYSFVQRIPKKKIFGITFSYTEQRCARGHCFDKNFFKKFNSREKVSRTLEEIALCNIFGKTSDDYAIVALINNNSWSEYFEGSPKKRVLAALYDLKRKEEKVLLEKAEKIMLSGAQQQKSQQLCQIN